MLYLIGLGLGDVEDITVKGLRIIKEVQKVYLESYTSILTVGIEAMEKFYDRKLILADREMVEMKSDEILEDAVMNDVAFLVVGDPLGATTHSDLLLRAKERNIAYKIIHNASIINAIGSCGLQLYRFGEVVSIVFWEENWKPECFYDRIVENKKRGLHTLCLLDIKMKEQTVENMMRGKAVYEPPRFMSVSQAAKQLLEISKNRIEGEINKEGVLNSSSMCIGVARIGADDQLIKMATLEQMVEINFGSPLHSLVVIGDMHPLEEDFVKHFLN